MLLLVLALSLPACGGDGGGSRTPAASAGAGAPATGTPPPAAASSSIAPTGGDATAGTAAAPTAAPAGATATFTDGVASGDVTASSAVLWTRAEGGDRLSIEIATEPSFAGARIEQATTSEARDFTVKQRLDGLAPATRYYYRFRAGEAVSAAGTFVTAPEAASSRPLRFVFSGDSDGTRAPDGTPAYNNFEVLDAAAAEDPAFFLYFGDTIYGDRQPAATTLDGYRAKYRVNRGYPALTNILARTSTYNTWDDHEVVNDFDGATQDRARLEAGRQAFREYMPIDDSSGDAATMYRTFRWGRDVELFALDERSFRSADVSAACSAGGTPDPLPGAAAPGVPDALRGGRGLLGLPPDLPAGCLAAIDDPSRTMLGAAQKEFLKTRLRASDATWKVIVNEVPMQQLLALPYDRWEGYAAERREILSFIRDNGIKNVVFLTTDLHGNIFGPVRMDVFNDPAPVAYEAVVGPIATSTLKRSIAKAVGETASAVFAPLLTGVLKADCAEIDAYSYGLVEVDPAGIMTITAKDAGGSVLCAQVLHAS